MYVQTESIEIQVGSTGVQANSHWEVDRASLDPTWTDTNALPITIPILIMCKREY